MSKVSAICISKHKGTLKNEVSEANFIEEFGIEGDAHAGKWHRQVSLLAFEKIDDFRNKGGNVDFGAFIYAEVEFNSIEEANNFVWPWPEILISEETKNPEYKMKNYWIKSRGIK